MRRKLQDIFRRLYSEFGPQHWWPAEDSFEVIIGAFLTQGTNWLNVEKAIARLKEKKALEPGKLFRMSSAKISSLIKSSGYHNIKAARIKEFLKFFFEIYQGDLGKMSKEKMRKLRKLLLSVKGIGPETADSILLYALNKPVFVVDAYTKRVFSRHGLINDDAGYAHVQDIFMRNLKNNAKMFNEYHALLVRLAKDYCRKLDPKCGICPLHGQ
ncbi:MAG: endonuclease III domain-containing protein [Candidatus Omnitrophica bacterium]|nr:endonuclease III domain-containing protein [Candidatus Omnitrophota bacterium]